MALQVEVLEERLMSFVHQLRAESGILDRVIYKNKNQHRRCSYFQYLLKVCRDLKLLHSIHMEEVLDSCFIVITGRKAKQKAHLLESLKKSERDSGKYNFMGRLLGVGRLLSKMVEPMLKAAVEISTLLARSFFMGFSLMILALLARLRVLVQQMLLDVVLIFNKVSSIACHKQSIKITHNGLEVFREYFPAMREVVTLDCVWKTDKFVLVETISKSEITHGDGSSEGGQAPLGTTIQYQSAEAFVGGGGIDSEEVDADNNSGEETICNVKRRKLESGTLSNEIDCSERVQMPPDQGGGSETVMPQDKNIAAGGSSLSSSSPTSASSELKPESTANKRVAFISVKKPTLTPSALNTTTLQVDESESKSHDDKENPFLCFFNGEDMKGSFL